MDESQPQLAAPDVPGRHRPKSVARLFGVRAVEIIDGMEHYTYRMLDEDLRMLDWDAGSIAANDTAILHRGKTVRVWASLRWATEAAGREPDRRVELLRTTGQVMSGRAYRKQRLDKGRGRSFDPKSSLAR